MADILRTMVVPFFAALFPAVWYVNRNLTTTRLPPSTEPSPALLAVGIAVSIAGSAVVAFVSAFVARRVVTDESTSRYRRVLQLDDDSLVAFAGFVSLAFLWAVVTLAGIGPAWLSGLLSVLLALLVLPFILLSPLAIRFHWAVVLGLVGSVVWMAVLATVLSDAASRWRTADGVRRSG